MFSNTLRLVVVVVVVLCHGQSDRISWRAAAQEGGVGGKVAGGRRMAGWLRMRPPQPDVPTSPRWSKEGGGRGTVEKVLDCVVRGQALGAGR